MARRTQGERRLLGALTAATVALPLALGAAPAQALSDGTSGSAAAPSLFRAKTENVVRAQLDSKERATFWVALSAEADTSVARKQRTKTDRGRTLYRAKRAHAQKTQAPLKALLDSAGATYESFWIANMVKVTADKALAEKIAARPEVAALNADEKIPLLQASPVKSEPKATTPQAKKARAKSSGTDAVEWNIDRINASKVWSEFGLRGEGIVVASVGTEGDLTHPAVRSKYRGLKADGGYDHNYNWFDAERSCPGGLPCTPGEGSPYGLGVILGDGGVGNRIGVAPGAKWMTVKGCGGIACTPDTVLRAAQWVIAPTDLHGANPRPDLAPHVVQHAWGGVAGTWFKTVVQAWRDAGIFTSYGNAMAGPRCNTLDSPSTFTNAYTTAGFWKNGLIDPNSSRGTGENGGIKPNISAPGEQIRTAWKGGGYAQVGGSGAAAMHTIGTVALMWSVNPALRGDITETERLLDGSATDVDDTSCGGTAAKNNVYGEGRLDAYAAVTATPRGTAGSVSGTVTSPTGPLADVALSFTGPTAANTVTDATGGYTVPRVQPGDYTVTATSFGYRTASGTVTVTANGTSVRDLALTEAPTGRITGRVTGPGGAQADVTIKADEAPTSVKTAADGTYTLELPLGTYNITATPSHRCATGSAARIETAANTVKDFVLAARTDAFGTECSVTTGAPFPRGTTKLAFVNPSYALASIDLPFPVPHYGKTYRKATVSVGGVLGFGEMTTKSSNETLPNPVRPNGALYPFWDDYFHDANSGVYWSTTGTAPHRKLVVEWRDAPLAVGRPHDRVSFAAVVGEDGSVSFHYKDISGTGLENASNATIGIENATGTDAFMYSYNEGTVHDGMSIHFRTTKTAVVTGTVTDANDGKPVAGATVAASGGSSDTTGADGGYLIQVPAPGAPEVTPSAPGYTTLGKSLPQDPGGIASADFVLSTGRVSADAASLNIVAPAGQQRGRSVDLINTGAATPYTATEKDGKSWFSATPASGVVAANGRRTLTVKVDTTGVAPGTVLTGTLRVSSQSGRQPVTDIPVSVVVPAYQTAIDTGASRALTDPLGDVWAADRAYTAGSHGYLGATTTRTTTQPITGVPATSDPALYRSARQGMLEYRFDAVPNGTYRVELGFAETASQPPGSRVFDVMAEGTQYVTDLDLTAVAGVRTAHDRAFTVKVTDGQLNLRFVANAGRTSVNAIRITERPDLTG
ncbi:carboxypeptidase regulatory-like domain-containing protein [Streptomyces albipurpureus]|uniref:Carboxypeptidase regulatory-like domain-containing protein n=1 Tax=Streptomyces albipurpureus TaxID=2897419 RepID=A0ABT0UPS7_9ACTN|nr:carboxypeptidase regulatory-like domain-containing protein [Streptomyces sp. CWNU-1]MCM2389605.1 carboxypeptidase regulatory-like domain-containing protein [Streptomyces sp. CWNU-1]